MARPITNTEVQVGHLYRTNKNMPNSVVMITEVDEDRVKFYYLRQPNEQDWLYGLFLFWSVE